MQQSSGWELNSYPCKHESDTYHFATVSSLKVVILSVTGYSTNMWCAKVCDVSAANDEGITALHNAICAGHLNIAEYLVNSGCDVNAPDNDGWLVYVCMDCK